MPLFAELEIPADLEAIEIAIEGLTALSAWEVRRARREGRPYPPLYESGIVYRKENPGVPAHPEDWQTIDRLYMTKAGDCEDVSNVRAAQLRDDGDEGAHVEIVRNPSGSYHAIVRRGDGELEDPSRILLALEERRKRPTDMSKAIVRTRDLGNYCLGEVVLPLAGGGSVRARGVGAFPWDALRRATSVAMRIASDPALAPFLPPGGALAIKEANALSRMAQNNPGLLKRAAPELAPAGKAIATSFLRHRARRGMASQIAQRHREPAPDDGGGDGDDDAEPEAAPERGRRRPTQEDYKRALERFASAPTEPADEGEMLTEEEMSADAERQFAEASGVSDAEGDAYFAGYEDVQADGNGDDLLVDEEGNPL
jgi:hypothetical protein